MKARCKYCRKSLGGETSNGTSHLRTHIKTCIQKRIHDGSQKILGPNYKPVGNPQLSASQYNLFFPKICDLRLKLNEWGLDPNPVIFGMSSQMLLKFDKYWDDIHLVLAVSVVLDPRYKLHVIEYYAGKFGNTETGLVAENIKQMICGLIRDYQTKAEKKFGSETGTSSSGSGSASATELDFELFVSQRKKSTSLITTELDMYLAEDIIPRTADFDLLLWWKLNGLKYPTLQSIARDFLAIPITSVPSESAFSSGGRLLDPHQSRLHYSTVEAMMCTRSWIMEDMQRGKMQLYLSSLLVYVLIIV
ncbi:unnamed protein product [Linum tenue]|uniref:BED-type domain-containing protein n=1 Tax=Linum tenue TaxID=586396 RepID=A0AAV0LBP4_9ROSI|nr:unnamed protein product [Linum tenue]